MIHDGIFHNVVIASGLVTTLKFLYFLLQIKFNNDGKQNYFLSCIFYQSCFGWCTFWHILFNSIHMLWSQETGAIRWSFGWHSSHEVRSPWINFNKESTDTIYDLEQETLENKIIRKVACSNIIVYRTMEECDKWRSVWYGLLLHEASRVW